MKDRIIAAVDRGLPRRVKDGIFHLGFNVSRERFRRFAYEYAKAPDMDFGLRHLSRRGFAPASIVDVGAYHGEWSALVHEIWPGAAQVMIEANLDKRPVLEPRAAGIGAALHFALLGAEDGQEVAFHVMESGSSVMEEDSPLPRRTETRRTARLDTVLDGRPAELLKLDVQGYELEVLRGAARTLAGARAVLLEVSLIEINRGAPPFHEVVGFMNRQGFRVADILGIHRRPLDRATNQVDLLFLRHGSELLRDTRHF